MTSRTLIKAASVEHEYANVKKPLRSVAGMPTSKSNVHPFGQSPALNEGMVTLVLQTCGYHCESSSEHERRGSTHYPTNKSNGVQNDISRYTREWSLW